MVGVQGWRLQSRPGESNGAMVRGSARNSVVGRAEEAQKHEWGLGMQPRGIERRTMGAGPERDMGGPERTADEGRAGAQERVQGKGAQSGTRRCWNVRIAKMHLVASHDVARSLAGM